ncbi:MAG TPA: hypothetical protein VLU95_08590, partial [Candidatus Acidoferrum sp.]|nr:hypothetical protein [Candidatus Acidoferrum sp.]
MKKLARVNHSKTHIMKGLEKAALASIIISVDLALCFVSSVHALAVVGSITAVNSPSNIAYDSGKSELFVVSSNNNGKVDVISDVNNNLVASIPVEGPTAIVYDSGKNELFVVNASSGNPATVSVISDYNNSVVTTIPVGGNGGALNNQMTYDSGKGEIFLINQNAIQVISDETNAVVATLPSSATFNPSYLAYDSVKGEIFAVNSGSTGAFSIISDASNLVVKTVSVGGFPSDLVF